VSANGFEVAFIGHACLKVSYAGTTLLTDPWLGGPAFAEQWYPYPLPDRSVPVDDVQYIQYSHGHEDHLHQPSFELLPKDATVLLTRQWFSGNREWLLDEGFEDVREMTSGRWMSLADDLRIVSLVNRSDSLSVLETPREVLVNVNDALHCYDDDCIDFYCRRIRSLLGERPIDYVFCGFGGASYFPNCLRHDRKDDLAVALAREKHLARGFARVVCNLRPRMAFAFAAGLVLLEPCNQWINDVKFGNDPVAAVLESLPEMEGRVFRLHPGDRIADGELVRGGAGPPVDPVADYRSIYADEIRAKVERPRADAERSSLVLRAVEENVRERLGRGRANKLPFDWAVRLRDRPEAILRLTLANGRLSAGMLPADRLGEVGDMVVEADSHVLLAGLSSIWGGDALQSGYGAIFSLRSDASVDRNHSREFLKLATKLPLQSDYLRRAPLRGIAHLIQSPYLARQALRIVLPTGDRPTADSAGRVAGMDSRRWIEASPCAGCPVCDLAPDA
jgi:Beta-lactamase superfamily domain